MEYNCSICKKKYKSYKSLWKHNSTFHKNISHPNTTIHTTETHINVENKCINCDVVFSRKDSLKRHIDANKCNKKENKIELIIKENLEMKKEMENLKSMLQSALKIHPKTLNKINNQLNVSGNMNNGYIYEFTGPFSSVIVTNGTQSSADTTASLTALPARVTPTRPTGASAKITLTRIS